MARRIGGRLIKTSAIDLMTRELLIGKNRRAPQKARRPKDFCLSITPAAIERKLGRGRNILCPGHDFRNLARSLLEIASLPFRLGLVASAVLQASLLRAEFEYSDSLVLRSIDSNTGNASGYLREIRGVVGNIDSDVSAIVTSLGNLEVSIVDIEEDLTAIRSDVNSSYYRLVNIETSSAATASGISSLSDMLDSRLAGISNAIANIPLCNVVVTNFLNTSGNIDMGIVTNIAEFLVGGSNLPYMNNTFFARLLAYLYGISVNDALADFEYLLANTPLGFFTYLWASALLPRVANDPFSQETSWPFINESVAVWSGIGADWEAEYTIFDAYNTLPLGRMTNQLQAIYLTLQGMTVKNQAIYETLQGWNNFHVRALINITNSLNKIVGDTKIIQTSVENNTTATEGIANSIGRTDAVDLDYEVEHEMPDWEPDYQESADENTNEVLYADASRYLQESMYQGKTNALGNIYSSFDRDPKRLNESLHFGGINPGHGHGYLGGWTMKIGFSESSSAYHELKRICRGVFDTICFVAHLCVFFIFSRRIVKFVTKPFPV